MSQLYSLVVHTKDAFGVLRLSNSSGGSNNETFVIPKEPPKYTRYTLDVLSIVVDGKYGLREDSFLTDS